MGQDNLSIVVTGANAGIGRATTKRLLDAGHDVAMVCRNASKAEQARDELSKGARGRARVVLADLSSPDQIRQAASELNELERIDVLINNAGIQMNQRTENEAGNELMFMVNHVAPHLLTVLLKDKLQASAMRRVITVSSMAHRAARVNWDDLEAKQRYIPLAQYANTKLMNIWFTKELHRRAKGRLIASCYHPGVVATEFGQDDKGALNTLIRVAKPFLRSPSKAARTAVYLATDPEASTAGGRYFADSKERRPSQAASDPALALRLWRRTVEMTGADYEG